MTPRKKTPEAAKPEAVEAKAERSPLLSAARRVLLASVGAVALAQDEIEDFVNRLVERGEIAEQDGKKLIREVLTRRRHIFEKKESELARRVEAMLERLKVPTKADIEALNEKIAALTQKIEDLTKKQS